MKLQNYVTGQWIDGEGEGSPIYNAVNGQLIHYASTKGIDFAGILAYGREVGNPALRKMTFHERGIMLKKLALYLSKRKDSYYEISYMTGATKADSWIDIEGGFGNLFANASLRRQFSNQNFHIDGEAIDLSRGGTFMGHHIMVPKRGVAVHINAYNFPVWGMLEKCAVNWMAGVPAVVKPATSTSYLTEAVVRDIIVSGILPEGALQLICGSARGLLDHVESQDIVTFTGSATTGRMLKSNDKVISEAVPFNMEADSLNSSVLGLGATPGTPEFDLFIKEVRREMTVKCGQKCTAIRRIIVPENLIEDVQIALGKALNKVTIGDPKVKGVRMGALASKDQVSEVRERVQELAKTAEIVFGDLDKVSLMEADAEKGAFLSPMLLLEKNPFKNTAVHDVEAFGPVSTMMPYKTTDEAITLAQMGKGSLVCSIATPDDKEAREFVLGAATHHGRILVINEESAKQSTGHGSPLPYLVHGGPGRAGGGEEMGGMRGIKHYLQRCAIQGSPTTISHITGIYQPNADYKESPLHPFSYEFEDIQPGMSIKTHKRTITDTDIINFANITWDHFYAHTDITSLDGSIFEKRTAHGYFLLAAAAGLFVMPDKGPVGANYGLDECRFLRPIYHNNTVYVRLTCKEKMDRDTKGKNLPAGVVKWYMEMFDEDDELVAMATILTLVQKKNPYISIDEESLRSRLANLTEDTKAKWGILKPQHMIEHLEMQYQISMEKIHVRLSTPPERLEKFIEFVYNHQPMMRGFYNTMLKRDELEPLKYESLSKAIDKLLETREKYETFFKENKGKLTLNPTFGPMSKFEWDMLNRKHIHHHFKQFGLV